MSREGESIEVEKIKITRQDFKRIVEQFTLDLERILWSHDGNTSVRYSINQTEAT